VAYVIGNLVYNLFFHPLRKFPGPLKSRATHLWRHYRTVVGDLPLCVKALHDEYGPVVRIAPDELSFTSPDAWHDIYGHHSYEMAKFYRFYRFLGEKHTPESIITAGRERHSALRRQLAHGFSDKAMRAQEPIINRYVDLLVERLYGHAGNGKKTVDLRTWFTFTTFDVIGNLGFGSDFGCLEKSYYHPWVKAITGNIRENAMLRVFTFYCPQSILAFLANHSPLFKERQKHNAMTRERILSRMAIKEERQDLIEGLLKKKDILVSSYYPHARVDWLRQQATKAPTLHSRKELSVRPMQTQDQLEMNTTAIIIAGSETTATLLSGAAFWIGTNPAVLEKLTQEVRSSFNSNEEITLASVGNLKYMLACLNETFRMYPPVAFGLPRVVPSGGATVAGSYVPENVGFTPSASRFSQG
jgi:cytochrome P450